MVRPTSGSGAKYELIDAYLIVWPWRTFGKDVEGGAVAVARSLYSLAEAEGWVSVSAAGVDRARLCRKVFGRLRLRTIPSIASLRQRISLAWFRPQCSDLV